MQFRDKVEVAVEPLIGQLRSEIASLATLDVLNHYQFRLHLSELAKEKLPDGFWAKTRYVWGLLLSRPFSEVGVGDAKETLARVDELVEKIFELYSFGAVYEPGRALGSESEFLARLGLAMDVREIDILGFPEQFRSWAVARLSPFDGAYFLPDFGLRFEDLLRWLDGLIHNKEKELNRWVNDMAAISRDIIGIERALGSGAIDLDTARRKGGELKIAQRLESNSRDGDKINILTMDDMRPGISGASLEAIVKRLSIEPGEIGPDLTFPHDKSLLDHKIFVSIPGERFFFLDPASVYRIAARCFENEVLTDDKLRDRYLRNRDRVTETMVAESIRKVFPNGRIYPNYYLEKGSREKDLFVREGGTVILVECKNSRIRAFRGTSGDLLKFERDFKNSVQFGYDQAQEAKLRILERDETTFFDEKGRPYFSVTKNEVQRIHIICVTPTPRGLFGTDLSYELKKNTGEPFPLALGLFDFQTICNHFDGTQFLGYLQARERLHGHARTADELNYAGYFLKFGHLNFPDGMFLTDDFSGIFDRRWYREKGLDVEEPTDTPVVTSMTRKGNRVIVEHSTGQREVIRVPPWIIAKTPGKSPIQMKGSERNTPCPCGSGLKLKHCCGVD
ncbi:MAG: SEC-C metal-binding domain-containing protein [Terriglobales bacterium]